MALDPRSILLGGAIQGGPASSFLGGIQAGQGITRQNLLNQQLEGQIAQAKITNPLQAALLEQQIATSAANQDVAGAKLQDAQGKIDDNERTRILSGLKQVGSILKPFVETGDVIGATGQLPLIESLNLPTESMQDLKKLLSEGSLTELSQAIANIEQLSIPGDGSFAIGASFLTVDDKGNQSVVVPTSNRATGELTLRTETIGGTVARKTTGETVTNERIEQTKQKKEQLANQKKLEKKFNPDIASAVAEGEAIAKANVEITGDNKSAARALDLYNTAMKGVIDSLAGTDTGPFIGYIPAITENQQIADGAIAAIAPVMKQMFRAAGEGIFTDKDQELLLAMIPTRKDHKAARIAKVQNIDAIVRAKLAPSAQISTDNGSAQIPEGLEEFMTAEERAKF